MAADDDQRELRALLEDSADRAFGALCDNETVQSAEEGDWPERLWSELENLGFTLAAVPESLGGSGAHLADSLGVLRLAGRHAVPAPLGETIIAAWMLGCSGQQPPSGPLSFGPVDRRGEVSLRARGTDWILDGSLRRIPWARNARRVALLIESDPGLMVVSVDPGRAKLVTDRNLAGEPRDQLVFENCDLSGDEVRAAPESFSAQTPLIYGALLRGQQMAGALRGACDLAVRYTSERIAFGKPLNKLQAVQQNLAVLAGQTAAAEVAADMVVDALDADHSDLLSSIAMAKSRIGEAVNIGARLAHQAHGAIGFTHEYSLHFLTRRLWSWRDEFGNEAYWARRVGERIRDQGADGFWQFVTTAARL